MNKLAVYLSILSAGFGVNAYLKRRKEILYTRQSSIDSAWNRSGTVNHDFKTIFINRNRVNGSKYWLQHMLDMHPYLSFGNPNGLELCIQRFIWNLSDHYYGHTPDQFDEYLRIKKLVYTNELKDY